MERLKVLKRCEIFLGLEDGHLERISNLPSCREESYEPQEVIFREGDIARYLRILDEGKIQLAIKAREVEMATIQVVTKGGIFGWSALVPPHSTTASAICTERAKVLAINGKELEALFNEEPRIGYEVMRGLIRVIGSRLRQMEGLIAMRRFTLP